jgi:hypothetical protein
MKPITHLELVPRLEIPEDTPPRPHTLHGEALKQGNFIFVVCFLLGNFPASEFYMPTFRRWKCSETSAYNIQTPGNYPEESIQLSEHDESLKSRILHLYGEKTA